MTTYFGKWLDRRRKRRNARAYDSGYAFAAVSLVRGRATVAVGTLRSVEGVQSAADEVASAFSPVPECRRHWVQGVRDACRDWRRSVPVATTQPPVRED